jgi:hypothetical protein
MKKLYKFYWNCRRQGSVNGLFIADEKEVKDIIGEEVYFGEILGKHSEIYGTIEEGEITEVKVSEITIKEMEEVLGSTISGYNPLNYIRYTCSRCEDTLRLDDCDWYLTNEGEKVCGECCSEEELESFTKIN